MMDRKTVKQVTTVTTLLGVARIVGSIVNELVPPKGGFAKITLPVAKIGLTAILTERICNTFDEWIDAGADAYQASKSRQAKKGFRGR